MSFLGERVKIARNKLGLTQGGVAKLINSDQTMISRAEKGELTVSQAYLELLYERGINLNWLHFGKENILVRKYDRDSLPKKSSLLEDFSNTIGLDENCLTKNKVTLTPNRGYSRDSLEIAKLCNPHLNNEERRFLRRMLQKTSSKNPFEGYSFWDQTGREQFLSQYTESNHLVAENYFPNLPTALFTPPKKDSNTRHYKGLSLETAVLTLTKAALPPPKQTLLETLKNSLRKKHYS